MLSASLDKNLIAAWEGKKILTATVHIITVMMRMQAVCRFGFILEFSSGLKNLGILAVLTILVGTDIAAIVHHV